MAPSSLMERLVARCYGTALLTYPPDFRRWYGADMIAAFEAHSMRRRTRGFASQVAFWFRAFGEVIPSAIRVRLEGSGHRQRFAPSNDHDPRTARGEFMKSVWQDMRYAVRTLRRTPLITAIALATLALGIGANTAIFSVINGVLFNPMSAPDAERVMFLYEVRDGGSFTSISYTSFLEYRDQATSLEHVGVMRPQSVAVTGGERPPERIRGLFVSAGYLEALGEAPLLGRNLLPGEDEPGGDRVALLSHGYWQSRYGGADVLGETIILNNYAHTIVGVMPSDFRFPLDDTSAWISLHTNPGELGQSSNLMGIARLASGATTEQASEDMALIADRLAEIFPERSNRSAAAMPMVDRFTGDDEQRLFMILVAAVAMVLLIGAANVANLQLARATGRGREMAIRTAIGGDRWRLIRQLLTENVLLAIAGGILGLAVAEGGIRLLEANGPGWGRRFDVGMDLTVLGFIAVVSLATSVLFGLAPALRASRVDLTISLREGSQALATGLKGNRLRSGLVVAQMALAVMLLIGAGLLLRSFSALQNVPVGFERDNMLTMQFRLPNNKYETDEQIIAFYDEMLGRVGALPGVQTITFAQGMPFAGDEGRFPFLKDGIEPGLDVDVPLIWFNTISHNYFEAMGIPLLAGRSFTGTDQLDHTPVAVVGQGVVDQFWPGEDVLGQTFRVRGDTINITIIGVVGDIRGRGLENDWQSLVYFAYTQNPTHFATIGVRVPSDPTSYTTAVRDAIWAIDADQPVWEIMTQNKRIGYWVDSQRFTTSLLLIFSGVALVLAAIGIAGVIAYMVGQRIHEIGIRLALGAAQPRILGMVMGQGATLLGLGLGVGILGALALSRLLSGVLFGVSALDVVSFSVAPVILAVVALLACYLPARRASKVDPGLALRVD
ncbi:MAG: ABC transporter permease [Gemmatimonadales bacterium]